MRLGFCFFGFLLPNWHKAPCASSKCWYQHRCRCLEWTTRKYHTACRKPASWAQVAINNEELTYTKVTDEQTLRDLNDGPSSKLSRCRTAGSEQRPGFECVCAAAGPTSKEFKRRAHINELARLHAPTARGAAALRLLPPFRPVGSGTRVLCVRGGRVAPLQLELSMPAGRGRRHGGYP